MYEPDLTDSQWQVIQEIVPDTRRRKHALRLIVNALFYLTKRGCQWRLYARANTVGGGALHQLAARGPTPEPGL